MFLLQIVTQWLLHVPTTSAQMQLDTSAIDFSGFGNITIAEAVENIVTTLQFTIIPVATALFVIGAVLYISAGDKEDRKNQGKELMIGSLIGVAIVVGAKVVVNFAIYFIYGT